MPFVPLWYGTEERFQWCQCGQDSFRHHFHLWAMVSHRFHQYQGFGTSQWMVGYDQWFPLERGYESCFSIDQGGEVEEAVHRTNEIHGVLVVMFGKELVYFFKMDQFPECTLEPKPNHFRHGRKVVFQKGSECDWSEVSGGHLFLHPCEYSLSPVYLSKKPLHY